MNTGNWVERDLKHVWHPCAQMKDYEDFPPVHVERCEGPFIYTADGGRLIDAVSSWWCKSLGHNHPEIASAFRAQLDKYEHVMGANTCQEALVELSERLAGISPGFDRVFYADNGSTAVEIAIKMSLQYHAQTGGEGRKRFASLKNGYHGETILTLAVGDCDLYASAYRSLMPEIAKLAPLPYVSGPGDSGWDKMPDPEWNLIESELDGISDTLSGIVFEPVLQGAGGMKIYSPDLLRRLRKWTAENKVHLIADEIMTGFGRTGLTLACWHAGIEPDFVCLSKGLTAGWTPMSAVLVPQHVYDAFYDDYSSGRAFLHSNTYSGYAPGAAAALKALSIYEEEKIFESVRERSPALRKRMEHVARETGALKNLRSVGFLVAADIVDPFSGKPFDSGRRTGLSVFKKAVGNGALLRPLGDTIYFLPPLNTGNSVLDELAEITVKSVKSALGL